MGTKHTGGDIQKTLQFEIEQTLMDTDGAGSDLLYANPFGGNWMEVSGNIDVEHLASHVVHVLGLEYEYATRFTPDLERPELCFDSRWDTYYGAMKNMVDDGKTKLIRRIKPGGVEVVD